MGLLRGPYGDYMGTFSFFFNNVDRCPYLVGNCYFTWHVNKVIIIIYFLRRLAMRNLWGDNPWFEQIGWEKCEVAMFPGAVKRQQVRYQNIQPTIIVYLPNVDSSPRLLLHRRFDSVFWNLWRVFIEAGKALPLFLCRLRRWRRRWFGLGVLIFV